MNVRARRLGLAALSVGLVLAGGIVSPASGSAAPSATAATTTPLPLSSFTSMVVDDAHGHVFVSGGPSDSAIAVLDFDGTIVGSIADEAGAAGMVLASSGHALYVAIAGGDHIDVIDTGTLQRAGTIDTTPATPLTGSIAEAGGRLWFGFGVCSDTPGTAAFASAAESATAPDVRTYPGTGLASAVCPGVFAGRATPDLLFTWGVGEPGLNNLLTEYDVSHSTPAAVATLDMQGGGWPYQMAEDEAGTTVFTAVSSSPRAYRVSNLQPADPPYYVPGFDSSDGVALMDGGKRLVAVGNASLWHDAYLFRTNGKPGTLRYWIGGDEIPPGGVGVAADDSRLFVIDVAHGMLGFRVIGDPLEAHANLLFEDPRSPIQLGESVGLSGTLGYTDETVPPDGTVVHLTRSNPDGSTTVLPDVPTNRGYFATTDAPPSAGTFAYTAAYPDDGTHLGATATTEVVVTSGTPSLTVTVVPNPVIHNGKVTVTVHLEQPSYDGTTNHTVTLRHKPFLHPPVTQTLTLDATNTATRQYTLPTNTSFTATWAGDADWQPITTVVYGFVQTDVTGALLGFYGTSNGFRLYHYNQTCVRTHTQTCPHFRVTASPNPDGGELQIEVQTYHDGAWHAGSTSTFNLDAGETITVALFYTGPGIKGVPLRVRGGFRSEAFAWSYSGWARFRITG
jgi:hypothetical protein